MIRIPQVRVVDEEGAQLGVMPTPRALEMAQERGLDLVEVAPMASPPVVKFLDFGQYKYDLTKREKEAKRKQRSVTFKEVRLSPKIGTGDFDTKVHRAIEFLEDGDRIKVTVRFRGRELTHPELGGTSSRSSWTGSRSTASPSGRHCSKARRCTSRWLRPTSRSRTRRRHRERTGPRPRRRTAPRLRPLRPLRPNRSKRPQHRRPKPRQKRRANRRQHSRHRRQPPRPPPQESEHSVPKIKSHKAAQKRIGVTGSGKVIRVKAWRGHHLEIKSSRRTRRYAGKAVMGREHAAQVRRLLPYL